MSGTSNQTRPGAASVEETLKDFWASRPRRPRQGRKVAGVAAAIGNRYGIDPVILRVAFVVATFYGGAGIVFYLLSWLLFPETDDETSPAEALIGRGRSSSSTHFTVGLVVAVIAAISFWFDFRGFLGLVVVAGLMFLLHRYRGHLNRPAAPEHETGPQMTTPLMTVPVGTTTEVPTPMTQPIAVPTTTAPPPYAYTPEQPPAWDPLGAAPFAWDLPEPATPLPDPEPLAPRRRSKVGAVTVATAFLFVGTAVIIEPYAGTWFSPWHVVGVVLGLLGLGMVVGSFTGGGRGLIGLAMPLAALGIAATVVWPDGFKANGVGDVQANPTTIADVQAVYSRDIGSINVDLTGLPTSGTVSTVAEVGIGDVTVTVPENADVTVFCDAGIGDVDCLGEQRGGTDTSVRRTDLGPDGAGGLKIELRAEVTGPGTVSVRRG
ncbi:phage shock protein PspC (stress-responsive transcriptional regulator)/predicted membrane protein [Actinokineospora baliensis]|uniref:PspC domain-containing protein n=1 Tax=Actinokineospora baliensis TaxID=547056 RepID=UPI00195671D2|nr:PspC domain-containing protein [Actinokineospora baliensis]MBM7770217.1 phage shock protein PspC (stress-responsive transcriptional regulator)/predicted membrane protein [Actinokineospora baliensis]